MDDGWKGANVSQPVHTCIIHVTCHVPNYKRPTFPMKTGPEKSLWLIEPVPTKASRRSQGIHRLLSTFMSGSPGWFRPSPPLFGTSSHTPKEGPGIYIYISPREIEFLFFLRAKQYDLCTYYIIYGQRHFGESLATGQDTSQWI